MAITIQDVLTLKSAQSFTLIAGQGGLNKPVEVIDMLDFAWTREKEFTRFSASERPIFESRSFLVSSLMFAANDTEKLYDTTVKLINCGVSGIAFKPAFYHKLPPEICKLANEHNFPIFRVDDYAITFREIICDVSDAISLNQNINEISGYLSRMLHEDLREGEIANLAAKISPYLRRNARIMIVSPKDNDCELFSIDHIVRSFRQHEEFKGKAVMAAGNDIGNVRGLVVIVTADSEKENIFEAITNHVLEICNLQMQCMRLIFSEIHPTFTMLNCCVIEAHQAYLASRVLERMSMRYRDLGTLAFLIPTLSNPHLQSFMQSYLGPIITNEENMRTAIAVIRASGDIALAAQELYVHKNTVRYRMSKIKELLSENQSDEVFYENLSSAIKIYLTRQIQQDCS